VLTNEFGDPDEHQEPKRAYYELDRYVEEEEGAWDAVEDEAEDAPDGT
jgi:hypothetical protein